MGAPINWTPEMVKKIKSSFAVTFNIDLAAELGVSLRTVVRKARSLGLSKESGFLDKNREEINKRAVEARPDHPMKGVKGWAVPNSKKTRFKPGNVSPTKDPEILARSVASRNERIKKERLRMKYGLEQETKLKLKP